VSFLKTLSVVTQTLADRRGPCCCRSLSSRDSSRSQARRPQRVRGANVRPRVQG